MEILHNIQETMPLQTLSLFQLLANFLKTLYISWDATRILRTHWPLASGFHSKSITPFLSTIKNLRRRSHIP